jgi:hypothetical protein
VPQEKKYIYIYLAIFYVNSRSVIKTYKTTTPAPYGAVPHSYERILYYLQTCYAQILIYLINHACFYIFFTDVQYFPEYDQDRPKHVRVMTNSL